MYDVYYVSRSYASSQFIYRHHDKNELDENAYIVMATKWSNNRYIMLLHIITLVICAKYNSTNLLSEDILTQNRT